MPYDHSLAERIRPLLLPRAGMSERAMFGGLGFLQYGNVCCGIWKDMLIVRCGSAQTESLLQKPHTRPFDITGKAMNGWLMIEPKGIAVTEDLLRWIEIAHGFTSTLPKKGMKMKTMKEKR